MEDIYDKLSCYYPINFKPPKDDKFKITPELLQTSLNNCFLATEHPIFIDNLLPFIIEKMSQDKFSREQSGKLLCQMVSKFDHRGPMHTHLKPVVSSLLNDYFNLMDSQQQKQIKVNIGHVLNQVEIKAVQNLKGVYQAHSGSLSAITSNVVSKCLDEIKLDPENMNAYLASLLISHLAGNTSAVMAKRIVSSLLTDHQSPRCLLPLLTKAVSDHRQKSPQYN